MDTGYIIALIVLSVIAILPIIIDAISDNDSTDIYGY